jgi:hypothetical protein
MNEIGAALPADDISRAQAIAARFRSVAQSAIFGSQPPLESALVR